MAHTHTYTHTHWHTPLYLLVVAVNDINGHFLRHTYPSPFPGRHHQPLARQPRPLLLWDAAGDLWEGHITHTHAQISRGSIATWGHVHGKTFLLSSVSQWPLKACSSPQLGGISWWGRSPHSHPLQPPCNQHAHKYFTPHEKTMFSSLGQLCSLDKTQRLHSIKYQKVNLPTTTLYLCKNFFGLGFFSISHQHVDELAAQNGEDICRGGRNPLEVAQHANLSIVNLSLKLMVLAYSAVGS